MKPTNFFIRYAGQAGISIKGLILLLFLISTGTMAKPYSLVIAIDGLRGDGIDSTPTPNLDQLISGTWDEAYNGAFAHYAQTMKDAAPNSGPNHVGIMTGVTATKHGVTGNGNVASGNYDSYPHYLKRLEAFNNDLNTAYLVTWGTDLQIPSGADLIIDSDDASNTQRAVDLLSGDYSSQQWPQGTRPDAIFLFLDDVDHAGHSCCFTVEDQGYRNEITEVDGQIGRILSAMKDRPNFENEDWQIVITSDHGGRGSSHGVYAADNFTIPFLVVSKSVSQGYLAGVPHNYDAAVTVLSHMGIEIPSNLDGKVQGMSVLPDAPNGMEEALVGYLKYEGDFNDSSSQGNHAVAGAGSPSLPVGGKFGQYLELNGTPEYLSFGQITDLDFGSDQDFTLLTWYRVASDQIGDPVIIGNKDWNSGANRGTLLLANEGNGDDLGINIASYSGDRKDIDPIDYTAHGWWMIVASFDREGASILYAGSPDGHLHMIADDISDVGDINSSLPWNIGQDGTGSYRYNLKADLDDTAIWRRALTKDEVKAIYNQGVGQELATLLDGGESSNPAPLELPEVLSVDYPFVVGGHIPVVISANVKGQVCSLQWDNTVIGGERNAKFDCKHAGDPMVLRVDQIDDSGNGDVEVTGIIYAAGGYGALEWDSYLATNNERNAKFDANASGDTVVVTFNSEPDKTTITTYASSTPCGLEWHGRKFSGERNTKWDCRPRFDTFLFKRI